MGHNRLGRLPLTRRWRAVVGLLDSPELDPVSVASAVANAADRRLIQLENDPGLAYTFWLLARISWAARGADFQQQLQGLGLPTESTRSAFQFISQVADHVRESLADIRTSGDFAEMGSMSLRRALAETVGLHGPSLFGSSMEDVQEAFRAYSTPNGFGVVAHRYFADFLGRTLLSSLDRELSNHIGGAGPIGSIGDSSEFLDALNLHVRQSARILESFAGGWYSKHNWESRGAISLEESQRFVAYAMQKLRAELRRQNEGT